MWFATCPLRALGRRAFGCSVRLGVVVGSRGRAFAGSAFAPEFFGRSLKAASKAVPVCAHP
ncbi:MAG: hypothetical protein N2110_01420 [Flavobacteriales bacterium]|nr:hypothetical protein [Flavobacteriales bacterium]MCX7767669.1 hypothetical protein [Flavobacteriales bacterium]MDW8410612.1 hypothetical protein [Flavobacteriales bacterium]